MKDETTRGSLVRVRPWVCGAALVLLAALAATPVHAFWYGESVRSGSDIIMMDLRWPFWAESTYYANWNCGIGGFAFYGGYNSTEPAVPPKFYPNMDPAVQDSIRPGSIWTFWGKNGATGEPVRTMATSRYNYLYQYVGEGASGAFYGGGWPIVRNKWYTMLIRVWKPVGPEAKKYRYIGRWTKDVEADHWYLFGVAKLPTGGTPRFNGNSGFLEDFGNGCRSVRSIHRRRGYCRVNGQWHSTHLNVLLTGKTAKGPFAWAYVPKYLENGTAIAIENCGQVGKLPFQHKNEKVAQFGRNHSYPVKQPPKPVFDKLIVRDVAAESNGRQVLVRWTVPPSSAPQLRYRVEVFDNPDCAGKPVAMEEQSLPYIQRVLVDAAVRNPTVKLTVTDIFENETKSVIVKARTGAAGAPAVSAVSGRRMVPGLRYAYRTKDDSRHVNVWLPKGGKSSACRGEKHYWVSLDELKDGKLVQQGISNGFDTSLRGRRNHGYGFQWHGFLKVPETGSYLFSVRGTDGYRLKIDGREAEAWDGLHGPEYRFFSANLAKGFHPIALDYFLDSKPPFLEIRWEGPGVPPQVVPSTALYHKADAKTPEVDFSVKQGKPGMVTVDVDIDPKGRRIERIDIYHGTIKIASLHGEKAKTSFTSFLPRGKEDVWLRLFYDGNHTIDSHKVALDIKPAPIKGWNVWVTGEKNLPYNIVQTAPNAFSFVGEGDYSLVRKVSGDFTMTAKIDSYMRSDKHPVNPSAWVGIRGLGPHSDHGLFQWADGKIRTSVDFPDVQGQRCGQGLYGSAPWLRIVRKGTLWSTWTSKDGKRWVPANSFIVPHAQNIRAGIMFSALPQNRSTYFSASISNVRVTSGVPDDIEIPSKTAEGTADVKMTGLAVAISDPNVVVVRTPGDGLLRSTDHGKTWAPANGALTGPANAVRSVAIHPANPAIMFRAAGYADKNGTFAGGLYKTLDGGKTWKRLPFDGDFDGRGPSALCGEVVVINNGAPNEVLAGTETKGLFRSTDGGKTWKRILPGDQRFTTVKYNRFMDGQRREVYAITAFDRVMPILGRGKPAFRTAPQVSRIYKSDNSGANFALKSQNPSRGFLNLTFFNFPGHELMLGTTHGFEYSCTSGATTFLFSGHPNLERLRPITAIASSMDEGFSGIYSRSLMQAINPERINKLCIGGHHWFWPGTTTIRAPYKGVLKIEAADPGPKATGRQWWFLGLKGLYYTSDKCKTFARVTPRFARVIPKGPDILIADFEGKNYGEGWKTKGNAFGSGPARGRLPRQGTPTRYQGKGLGQFLPRLRAGHGEAHLAALQDRAQAHQLHDRRGGIRREDGHTASGGREGSADGDGLRQEEPSRSQGTHRDTVLETLGRHRSCGQGGSARALRPPRRRHGAHPRRPHLPEQQDPAAGSAGAPHSHDEDHEELRQHPDASALAAYHADAHVRRRQVRASAQYAYCAEGAGPLDVNGRPPVQGQGSHVYGGALDAPRKGRAADALPVR